MFINGGDEDLEEINNLLHDLYFDLDEIRESFSGPGSRVRFRLGWTSKSLRGGRISCVACIECVDRLHLEDVEQISTYDFNVMQYSREEKKIRILTSIPSVVEFSVSAFRVAVTEREP